MDQKEGHNFMACGQAYGLDLGPKDDGHGISGLGLQCIKERNTIAVLNQ